MNSYESSTFGAFGLMDFFLDNTSSSDYKLGNQVANHFRRKLCSAPGQRGSQPL